MKKLSAFFIILLACFTLVGCGKTVCSIEECKNDAVEDELYGELYCTEHLANRKAYDISKEAYENITKAYEIVEQYGDDIYDGWYIGIFNTDELYDTGSRYLASELNLSEEDVAHGFAFALVDAFGWNWDEIDQETKEQYMIIDGSGTYFLAVSLLADIKTFCVECVNGAYEVTGKTEEALLALEEAKAIMKQMSEKYEDYEHYPALKAYYTETSSFLDFCSNPTGSFDQLPETLNKYKNNIRDLSSDLAYIFEQ